VARQKQRFLEVFFFLCVSSFARGESRFFYNRLREALQNGIVESCRFENLPIIRFKPPNW